MFKNVVAASKKRINAAKKIVVLLCFIACPALQIGLFEKSERSIRLFDLSRLNVSNRVYGLPSEDKNTNQPVVTLAPNMHVGHELSVFLSAEMMHWNVSQENEMETIPSEQISPITLNEFAPGIFLRYAYHFPFSSNFGFFLGTTLGFNYAKLGRDQFRAGYHVLFPTILLGFTGSPTENDRITLAAEYGAIYFPKMTVYTNVGTPRPLNATLDGWNFFAENDYFFTEDIGFSVTAGMRLINNRCSLAFVCNRGNYINTLNIRSSTYYAQFGFVFGDLR